jgi:hypothetical protein
MCGEVANWAEIFIVADIMSGPCAQGVAEHGRPAVRCHRHIPVTVDDPHHRILANLARFRAHRRQDNHRRPVHRSALRAGAGFTVGHLPADAFQRAGNVLAVRLVSLSPSSSSDHRPTAGVIRGRGMYAAGQVSRAIQVAILRSRVADTANNPIMMKSGCADAAVVNPVG